MCADGKCAFVSCTPMDCRGCFTPTTSCSVAFCMHTYSTCGQITCFEPIIVIRYGRCVEAIGKSVCWYHPGLGSRVNAFPGAFCFGGNKKTIEEDTCLLFKIQAKRFCWGPQTQMPASPSCPHFPLLVVWSSYHPLPSRRVVG